MEGTLYKWDGYFSGWNKKYCAISNGKLDIYSSKESMNKGSPVLESYNIGLCEISVDQNTATQWELKGPNSTTVCFKTDQKVERQRWLKILGSVKACMMDTSSLSEALTSPPSTSNSASSTRSAMEPVDEDNTEQEQVSSNDKVQESHCATEKEENETINIDKTLNDLVEFCDSFEAKISSVRKNVEARAPKENIQQVSLELIGMFGEFASLVEKLSEDINDSTASTDEEKSKKKKSNEDSNLDEVTSSLHSSNNVDMKPVVKTFFSSIDNSFQVIIDDALKHKSETLLCSIQTGTYLRICSNYTRFFDLFGGTLFSPLKSDMLGNIEKIKQVMKKDPARYSVLQYMIDDEIHNKTQKDPNGATQALLWMMRGLRTIAGFFYHSSTEGTESFKVTYKALDVAYRDSLKKHHNFVVKKMFTMGIKLIPSFTDMVRQVKDDQIQPNEQEEIDITGQMKVYSETMLRAIKLIEPIYHHHQIEL